jgi:hypothetical protein
LGQTLGKFIEFVAHGSLGGWCLVSGLPEFSGA